MAEEKKKFADRVKVSTLKGIAVYPKLNKPDEKYGKFGTKILLSAAAAQPLIDIIEPMLAKQMAETKAQLEENVKEAKGAALVKAKKALADLDFCDKPYKEHLDKDSGEPTGEFVFNFSMKPEYKDRKTGNVVQQRPKLVDSKGTELDPTQVNVWGGSVIQVGGFYSPFYTAVGVGVSGRLAQVRILKLVTGNGGGDFEYDESEDEEDGFVAPAAKPKAAGAAGAPAGAPAGAEDDEF